MFQTSLLQRAKYGEKWFLSLLSEGTYAEKKGDLGMLKAYGSVFKKIPL